MGGEIKLALASASPRRKEMLEALGWRFITFSVDIDESPGKQEPPSETALRLAREKAAAGSLRVPGVWTIGADTVVDLEGAPYGKPADRPDAARMLRALAGRTHTVHTGVAVAVDGMLRTSAVESTRVRMAKLSDEEIAAFLETGLGDDKAGAYAIQGRGALLVERVEGCYSAVVGMPIFRLSRMLRDMGWSVPSQWRGPGKAEQA